MPDPVLPATTTWNYPTTVIFGAGAVAKLGRACASAGIARPLVVTDPALARLPAAETVRVTVAAMGLALTLVSVRASNSSTHENMKQKNAATPIPLAMRGMKIFTKKRGNE